jgi:cardiolipin synthase
LTVEIASNIAAPDASGHDWTLWNEKTITPVMVDAVDHAKSVVDVEFFAFNDAGNGQKLVDALVRARQRDVEVNVYVDSSIYPVPPFGSFSRLKHRIEAAGGTVMTNLKGRMHHPDGVDAARHVDHRKVVVVDGDVAFTGGINFYSGEDAYPDSMVRLTGANAARLAVDQLDRWKRVGGVITGRHQAMGDAARAVAELWPATPKDMNIRVNAPEQGRFQLTDDYTSMIRGAKQRIWISSPAYSDQKMIDELRAAAKRGVDVRIVTPGKAPIGVEAINWFSEASFRPLLEDGGRAYAIPSVLHRKVLLADNEVVTGSYNITNRSRVHDHEIGVRTTDPAFVQAMADRLRSDMETATQIDPLSQPKLGVRALSILTRKFHVSY